MPRIPTSEFDVFVSTLPQTLFPRLESLTLNKCHPDAALILLTYMSGPSLKTIEIIESKNHTPILPWRISTFKWLGSKARGMKVFAMKQSDTCRPFQPGFFCGFRALETLDITGGFAMLSDEALRWIARELTNLKYLAFPVLCYKYAPRLKCLWTPSMFPPRLQHLRLSILLITDTRSPIPFPSALLEGEIPEAEPHTHLRHLAISSYYGPLTDVNIVQLAKLIHRAFPKLEVLEEYVSNFKTESWDRVNTFRATLREVCEKLEQDIVVRMKRETFSQGSTVLPGN